MLTCRRPPSAKSAGWRTRQLLLGSIITTSHIGISGWAERLGDPMLAAAALDRLLHRGVIVGIDGPSYRMRAHQHRADVIRAAAGTGASR